MSRSKQPVGRRFWLLTAMPTGQPLQAGGAIPLLVGLLGSGSEGVQRNAAGALTNLAANHHATGTLWTLADNNDANQAAIAAAGAIPPLVGLRAVATRVCRCRPSGRWGVWLSTTVPAGQPSPAPAPSNPCCGCWQRQPGGVGEPSEGVVKSG